MKNRPDDQTPPSDGISRREFINGSTGVALTLALSTCVAACGNGTATAGVGTAGAPGEGALPLYAINPDVQTTAQRTVVPSPASGLAPNQLPQIDQYGWHGYGKWTYGPGLPWEPRTDLMANGYILPSAPRRGRLLRFFAFTDIHLTDKEAPNQLIYLQQTDDPTAQVCSSIYSGVMLYTPHVFDAAVQTINALHRRSAFDFGISLGDASNSTAYNELRWYIDILDGRVITPSSGAHVGADTIDYQKPFQAAGLDPSIPWFQVMGNHDRFYTGSFDVYQFPNPAFDLAGSYTSDKVWAVGDVFSTHGGSLNLMSPTYYQGTLNGATPNGDIIKAGPVDSFNTPPTVVPDANRRALRTPEWLHEFFNTLSAPVGHGFNLVPAGQETGFACYSFVPRADMPLKIIVLDDNQTTGDGSYDIHGHGFLDEARWTWLQNELTAGDAAGQLMIIAAHIPIGVTPLGGETEWWRPDLDPYKSVPGGQPRVQNAATLQELVNELQSHPNFLLWIAGHRHVNVIKAFPGPTPEQGFWQVETSSLRDYPQQFRTFEVEFNSDATISIFVTNVDPSVAEGTPAARSRALAVATQQIVQTPSIYQQPSKLVDLATQLVVTDASGNPLPDPSIRPMPAGSYNAELVLQLTTEMQTKLQALLGAKK